MNVKYFSKILCSVCEDRQFWKGGETGRRTTYHAGSNPAHSTSVWIFGKF